MSFSFPSRQCLGTRIVDKFFPGRFMVETRVVRDSHNRLERGRVLMSGSRPSVFVPIAGPSMLESVYAAGPFVFAFDPRMGRAYSTNICKQKPIESLVGTYIGQNVILEAAASDRKKGKGIVYKVLVSTPRGVRTWQLESTPSASSEKVSICTDKNCCKKGSLDLLNRLRQSCSMEVAIQARDCLGRCKKGPVCQVFRKGEDRAVIMSDADTEGILSCFS
eukprot:CAMPEP_0184646104 /NCGR_PEP_ID=MMETSP0308-20130426/2744_1 /TAXON_ID=38269 /ORGANISM="Gloeochaete witrockiana, Strain SAG 46.84" /LENGTH=219 /DNA_ID=CAMNT_0027075793 /DNA_START=193 /DNA_END=852 /DNA_ORIENTATION=+